MSRPTIDQNDSDTTGHQPKLSVADFLLTKQSFLILQTVLNAQQKLETFPETTQARDRFLNQGAWSLNATVLSNR